MDFVSVRNQVRITHVQGIRRRVMSNRKTFHDSVTELPEQPGITPSGLNVSAARPEHLDEKMTLSFSLAIPPTAHDDLEAKVGGGEVVWVKDLNTKYAVPQAQVDPVVAWLKAEGFEVTHISNDRTSVFARGTIAQIEKSLGVTMVRV